MNTTATEVVITTNYNNATMSTVWSVEAFLKAFDITHDQLCFVHNHGYLKVGKAEVLPEQLTDGQWNTLTLVSYNA